jgi:hypothetical protein
VAKTPSGEARKRAADLLFSWLTPEQQSTASRSVAPYFDVVGNHTGKKYRINMTSTTNNVASLGDNGEVVATHCCYPRNCFELPQHDTWLAQALSITGNESGWLRVAVTSPLYFPRLFPNYPQDYYGGTYLGAGGAGGGNGVRLDYINVNVPADLITITFD